MRMKMRVLTTKLRLEIENEMRVFLESLNFKIEMRVSQKSVGQQLLCKTVCLILSKYSKRRKMKYLK